MRHRPLLVLAAIGLAACSDPLALRVEVTDLRTLEPSENAVPIALEIDPDTHALEVVYRRWGGDLAMVPLARDAPADTEPRWVGSLPVTANGIVALGDRMHAVLGEGLGYDYNERAGSLRELFCFFPGADEGEWPPELEQRSRALAHEPASGRLWAQPRTFRRSEAVRSEIAAWDDETGEELGWWTVDTDFEATAMAVLPDGILVLADWRAVHAFDPESGVMAELATLDALDLVSVRAMVWDPVDERVLALELPSARVVSLSFTR